MSTADSTDRQPPNLNRNNTIGIRNAKERTTREFVGDQSELPPIDAGESIAGRYVVLRSLGRGGFSDVYLAQDCELDRQVAMKRLLLGGLDTQHMKDEAKVLASLDHPSIVRIFDICEDSRLGFFMLMQYVPGPSLRELMRQPLSIRSAVDIAIRICGGLIHAHSRGVVHRDIKPTNVIMNDYGDPLITDFGLALTPASKLEQACQGGTPRYMSPEQIRQETNRISPSSDIFSAGIVLYEMLCGQVPFNGSSPEAISAATLSQTPLPLNTLNTEIPDELDRICRRALRKNVKDRYGSMEAFQADLIYWLRAQEILAKPSQTKECVAEQYYSSGYSTSKNGHSQLGSLSQISLRGLQPFQEEDASFYVSLIPGAIAPNGLPDSLQFWKQWIESYDNSTYSRVGVLYGPCGSGKTSFLRAGVTPHLSPDILPIYLECHAGNLSAQLREAICDIAGLMPCTTLTGLLIQLRENPEVRKEHRKVILLLDQFDAWASSATTEELQAMAASLRHCDGESLQALIVIRDDYWIPTTEFLHLVECGVEQWKNARSVELIDRHHAKRLLESVGRSYGSLPAFPEPLDPRQTEFLDRAIEQLVNKGRIVPIQLAMFIKMAKLLPWHPETLTHVGETQGMYVSLFQDLFEGRAAPPVYQRVKGAVADILHLLLPAVDQTVRNMVISAEQLEKGLGMTGRQSQFHRALQILIEDLRLVIRVSAPIQDSARRTPLGGRDVDSNDCKKRGEYYQLANDFLVEPIALWVNQVCKSDWRGRAKGRLEELSAIWSRRQEKRYLPTLFELLEMQLAVPRRRLTATQRTYLNTATRVQASVCATVLAIFLAVGLIGWCSVRQYNLIYRLHEEDVSSRVDAALHNSVRLIPALLENLPKERELVQKYSKRWLFSSDPIARTRARLLNGYATQESFEQIALDFPVIEPLLGPLVIDLTRTCADSKDLVRELHDQAADTTVTKVRAALTLAYLEDEKPLLDLLDFGAGGDINDLTLNQALTWKAQPELWTRLLLDNSSQGATYHALGVLASYPTSELPEDFPWTYVEDLCHDVAPCIRTTARWFLDQAGHSYTAPVKPSPNEHRFATGLEFTRVKPGTLELSQPLRVSSGPILFSTLELKNPLWISSSAISNQQFQPFLAEFAERPRALKFKKHIPSAGRSPDHEQNPNRPMTGYEAEYLFEYCNWLSEKAGLSPSYQAVESAEEFRFEPIVEADGFRLPSVRELIYAFAARATAPTLLGTPLAIRDKCNPETAFSSQLNFFARTDLAKDLMPNRFGIHFMEYSYWNLVETDGEIYNLTICDIGKNTQYLLVKLPQSSAFSSTYLVQGVREPVLSEGEFLSSAGVE